ncbi:MAG: glycosyltransferase, partial [Ignavibacteriae bacterium]|nr:glycosyltransferase [Ignavibacteriota bacterium]
MSILHPEAIFIQLHTHCNAECINCPFEFTYNKIHQNGRMSESTWKKILTDLINMDYSGQVGFYLHHEPLIDKTLFDKIKDINEKTKAYVVLSTNGQLLNEENILKLIKSKPKKVHLNINSGNKKEYEESMKGLHFETTINNCTNFIEKAKDIIDIEINCPIIEGFDVNSLKSIFPQVKVNLDYWANSRGGLLTQFYKENKGSRFKGENYCTQPSQNFNILFDGSVVACCMDWMHETKKDFMNINNSSIIEVYNVVKKIEKQFIKGDYSKYNMCNACSKEMGFYRDDNKLNILITNHQLLDFTGSEIYTYTLAEQLVRNGHNVTIYTKYADKILNMFKLINVKIITNINEIANENFDIAHIHHNIMAIEVRYYFPSLPIVFLSHGVIPFLEQPPIIDLGISKFIAVSEEVKNNLISKGIDEKKIDVIRNIIDPIYFFPISEINEKPQKALIITNKMNLEVEKTIKEACNWLNIKTEFIGRRFEEVSPFEMGKRINKADIVFSLGRGIIEAIMCERVPIIFDRNGGDGIVTSENVELYMNKNFSGRTKNKIFNVEELIKEIEKYNKKEVKKLSKFINQHFGPNNVDLLIEIYK